MTAEASQVADRTTVLFLEPDIIVRSEVGDFLRDCGFMVIEAADSDEAMQILSAADTTIDILLADATAPGTIDGFGLARWVRADKPGIAVILTGTPAHAAKEAGELCADDAPLTKPYEPQLLLDRITRHMAARDRAKKPPENAA